MRVREFVKGDDLGLPQFPGSYLPGSRPLPKCTVTSGSRTRVRCSQNPAYDFLGTQPWPWATEVDTTPDQDTEEQCLALQFAYQ